MRIALVADEDPGWGGIGTYTGIMGAALGELGHEVHLVLRGWEHEGIETLDGLTVHRVVVPEPSWRRGTVAVVSRLFTARESLVFAARTARAIARIAPDVVEAPEFHAPGLVVALRGRLNRRAPRVVVRLHAPGFLTAALAAQPPDLDLRATELLEAAGARLAQLVTSPSRALAELVQRRWRLGRDSVRVVPNPIDTERFSPGPAGAEDPATILVVGRVERAKGQDVLVEALPAIRAAVPGVRVRLVGADGGLAAPLVSRARRLGVGDALAMDGACPREQLPAAYRSATICAAPSRFEAFGYGALEAMACGRPVVAAAAGGLPEVIEPGAAGVLVAPEDPAALAQALIALLADPAERRRLGAAARERVLATFAADRVAARIAEHYAEAVA